MAKDENDVDTSQLSKFLSDFEKAQKRRKSIFQSTDKTLRRADRSLASAEAGVIIGASRLDALSELSQRQVDRAIQKMSPVESTVQQALALAYNVGTEGFQEVMEDYFRQLSDLYWQSTQLSVGLGDEGKELLTHKYLPTLAEITKSIARDPIFTTERTKRLFQAPLLEYANKIQSELESRLSLMSRLATSAKSLLKSDVVVGAIDTAATKNPFIAMAKSLIKGGTPSNQYASRLSVQQQSLKFRQTLGRRALEQQERLSKLQESTPDKGNAGVRAESLSSFNTDTDSTINTASTSSVGGGSIEKILLQHTTLLEKIYGVLSGSLKFQKDQLDAQREAAEEGRLERHDTATKFVSGSGSGISTKDSSGTGRGFLNNIMKLAGLTPEALEAAGLALAAAGGAALTALVPPSVRPSAARLTLGAAKRLVPKWISSPVSSGWNRASTTVENLAARGINWFRGSAPTTLGDIAPSASRVASDFGKKVSDYSKDKVLLGSEGLIEKYGAKTVAQMESGIKNAAASAAEGTAKKGIEEAVVETAAKQGGTSLVKNALGRGWLNVLFAGVNYQERLSAGQSKTQAAAGAAAGAVGGIIGSLLALPAFAVITGSTLGIGTIPAIATDAAVSSGTSWLFTEIADALTGAGKSVNEASSTSSSTDDDNITFSQLSKEQQQMVLVTQAQAEHGKTIKHNNPGNIMYSSFAKQFGATPSDETTKDGTIAQFPSMEMGWKAQRELWNRAPVTEDFPNPNKIAYKDLPIKTAVSVWARNAPPTYAASLIQAAKNVGPINTAAPAASPAPVAETTTTAAPTTPEQQGRQAALRNMENPSYRNASSTAQSIYNFITKSQDIVSQNMSGGANGNIPPPVDLEPTIRRILT